MKPKSAPLSTFVLSLFIILSLNLIGCLDIIEPNLDDETVEVIGPRNDYVTPVQSITFWWEEIDLQEVSYELEIVEPSFDFAENLVVKEATDDLQKTISLLPGTYEWRINAIRLQERISSTIQKLTILTDSTNDLSGQIVNLVSPDSDLVTNKTSIDFLWQELQGAEEYLVQVGKPDFSNSTFLVLDERFPNDYVLLENLEEGEYRWRVRAENENSISPYTTQTFEIDLTAPATPILLLPVVGDSVSLPSILSWNSEVDAVEDSIFIFQDSLLQSLVLQVTSSSENYILDNIPTDKKYFWQVSSKDQAGNISSKSNVGQFFAKD